MKFLSALFFVGVVAVSVAADDSFELDSDEVVGGSFPLFYSAGPSLVASPRLYTAVYPLAAEPTVVGVDEFGVGEPVDATFYSGIGGRYRQSVGVGVDRSSFNEYQSEAQRLKRKQSELNKQQQLIRQRQVLLQQQLLQNQQQYDHLKNKFQQQRVQQQIQQQHFDYRQQQALNQRQTLNQQQPFNVQQRPLAVNSLSSQRVTQVPQFVQSTSGQVQQLVPQTQQPGQFVHASVSVDGSQNGFNQVVAGQPSAGSLPVASEVQTQTGTAVLIQGVSLQPINTPQTNVQQPFTGFGQQQSNQPLNFVNQRQPQQPFAGSQQQQLGFQQPLVQNTHTGFSQQDSNAQVSGQFYSQDVDEVEAQEEQL